MDDPTKMANILLVDPDRLAQKAMKGILARGDHRLVTLESAEKAWEFIRSNVKVDLVFTELRLKGDGGLVLIQRLKNDSLLRALPVVVYTAHADRDSVKKALDLHVQSVLLKPYREEAIFSEISKALAHPWLQGHFEKATVDLSPDQLKRSLEKLRSTLEQSQSVFGGLVDMPPKPIADGLEKLARPAEKLGAKGVVACLRDLEARALAGTWPDGEKSLEPLEFASQLIDAYLHLDVCPESFLSEEESGGETEEEKRAYWASAAIEDRCPVIGWDQLKREIDALSGCPIIDSIAASFQMSANGHPTSLNPLLDLVQKDPGLTAQILIAANGLKRSKDDANTSPIEDARMAVGQLGELRLSALGGNMITVDERRLLAPPYSSWPKFRMFQLGTARLSHFVCSFLEMPSLEASAYTAGLIHDIGKLLLIHLHPYAFQAIHDYAVQEGITLASAERFFIGATTHEMAAYFAEKQGLPRRFANVLRWMNNAEEALEDQDLVAVVSLARDLCRHNNIGSCGDTPKDDAIALEDTPEWHVLSQRSYISFDLKVFKWQAKRECRELKRELQNQMVK